MKSIWTPSYLKIRLKQLTVLNFQLWITTFDPTFASHKWILPEVDIFFASETYHVPILFPSRGLNIFSTKWQKRWFWRSISAHVCELSRSECQRELAVKTNKRCWRWIISCSGFSSPPQNLNLGLSPCTAGFLRGLICPMAISRILTGRISFQFPSGPKF